MSVLPILMCINIATLLALTLYAIIQYHKYNNPVADAIQLNKSTLLL